MSDEQNTTNEQEPDHIKALRDKAKQTDSLASEKSQLERKVAILEAGVNTTTPIGQMFLKSYEGELTPEAIKAAAAEVGLVEGQPDPEPQPGEPGTPEAQQQSVRDNLAVGDIAPHEEPVKSAKDRAWDVFNESRKGGMREEDARNEAFASFIEAGIKGDQTALYREPQY